MLVGKYIKYINDEQKKKIHKWYDSEIWHIDVCKSMMEKGYRVKELGYIHEKEGFEHFESYTIDDKIWLSEQLKDRSR